MFNNNLLMGAAAATSGTSLVSVGNSALLVRGNSEYLSWSPASDGNRRTWTFSQWQYFGAPMVTSQANDGRFLCAGTGSGNGGRMEIYYVDNQLIFFDNEGTGFRVKLAPTYHSGIGWHHFVFVVDTPNAVSIDRMRVYHNGVLLPVDTSYTGNVYPAQNYQCVNFNTAANTFMLGADARGLSRYADGYIAESIFIDGLALEPTSFGEFDSTGTFWTPKSSAEIKALTFGTNGFYLDNTTNAETDASGNGNNFTNNNTVTTSTNTPTNIFNLWNPLFGNSATAITLTNGNQTAAQASASDPPRNIFSTIPLIAEDSSGFYAEITCTNVTDLNSLGIVTAKDPAFNFGSNEYYLYDSTGGKRSTGNTQASYGNSYTDGDVIGICVKNGKIYFSKNGTFQNSGDPSTGTESGFAFENISGPFVIMFSGGGSGTPYTITLNSGQSSYSATPPTGTRKIDTTAIASATTRTHSNLEEYFDTTLYEGNGAGQRVGKFLPFTNTFTVGNSGLFKLVSTSQDTGNPRLTRTQDAGASNKKFSFSFWYKRGQITSSRQTIWNNDPAVYAEIRFDPAGTIAFEQTAAVGAASSVTTTRVFTDTSQWYNVIIVIDTTQATASDRQTIYVNGVSQTLTIAQQLGQNADTTVGGADPIGIGSFIATSSPRLPFDGYLAEFVYVNDQVLSPSDVGQVDTSTGRWIPKTLGGLSFGSTDYYLNFATLGEDVSGNDNDFTNANVVQASDTPTTNFAVFDANFVQSGFVLSNGNQTADASSTNKWGTITLPITTGKWFGVATTTDANSRRFGVASNEEDFVNLGSGVIPTDDEYAWAVGLSNDTTIAARNDGTNVTGTIQTIDRTNDRYAVAIDCDNRKVWLGVYDNSAGNIQWIDNGGTVRTTDVPASGVNETYILTGTSWRFFAEHGDTGSAQTIDFGQSSFGGASLPSGFLGLNQDNMPEGESYQTAFSWIKNRDATDSHMLFDRVRGIYNDLHSDAAVSQVTNVNTLQRFLNGGVQVGNDVQVNTASESYVAWNWYMETAGSGTSNTDGSTNTEATLVDTNLGLSISKFDSGASGDHTIGHGLGVVPEFVIFKELESANNWAVYHSGAGFTDTQDFLLLNTTSAKGDNGASIWGAAFPTSTVLGFTSGQICNVNKDCVALCFAPSQFTSIGSYQGNGNANGTFVPTVNSLGVPIQPAWTIVKRTDAANSWGLGDGVRDPFNPVNQYLAADNNAAEASYSTVDKDYVLGGFKARGTSAGLNASGGTYIYMAFGTPIIDVDGRIITGR